MRSPGRPKMLRISAGRRRCCRTSAARGVERGDLARPEHPVLVAEDEAHVPGQDVDPLVAVVGARLGGGLAGRDDDLPRLHAVRLPGQRDHGPALDPARLEPEPRVALLGRARPGRRAAPDRRATGRAAAPGSVVADRSPAATACSSRSPSTSATPVRVMPALRAEPLEPGPDLLQRGGDRRRRHVLHAGSSDSPFPGNSNVRRSTRAPRPTCGGMNQYDVASSAAAPPACPQPWSSPGPAAPSWWSTPGAPRNAPAATCTATSPATAWPPAELLATGRDEVSGVRRRHPRRHGRPTWCPTADRVPGSCSPVGSGSRPGGSLVTTGLRDELPDIPGLRDRWARDVLHCPYCHGHEVRDRQLGVSAAPRAPSATPRSCGSGPTTSSTSPHPTCSPPPSEPSCVARAIGIVEGTIDQLVIDDDDHLRGVQMARRLRHPARRPVRAAPLRPQQRPPPRPRLRRRRRRLGQRRPHRTHQRPRRLGRRQRRRPPRPGHHRRRRRLRRRHRPQRRPRRRRRAQRRPRPRPRSLDPAQPTTRRSHCHDHPSPTRRHPGRRPSISWP